MSYHIDIAFMKCPYCDFVFALTELQIIHNQTFTCPKCHKVNQGSVSVDKNGALIGKKGVNENLVL